MDIKSKRTETKKEMAIIIIAQIVLVIKRLISVTEQLKSDLLVISEEPKSREELTLTRRILRKIKGKFVFVDVMRKYIKEDGKLIRISGFFEWFLGKEPKGNIRTKRSCGASEPVEIPELPNNKSKTFVQRFDNISFKKLRKNRRK